MIGLTSRPRRFPLWWGILVILATIGLLSACSLFGPGEEASEELARAERRWHAAGIADYRYPVERLCYCPPASLGPAEVVVRGGSVAEVRVPGTGEALPPEFAHLFPGVEGLFEVVRDAIRQDPHRLDVDYHDGLGYPMEIDIDYRRDVIDEELSVLAGPLIPIPPS